MKKIIQRIWEYKGRKCVILWVSNSHFCAYVETKLKDVGYSDEFGSYETSPGNNIRAHGGLTFSGELEILNDNKYYFGMDFAHCDDYIEGLSSMREGYKWTLEEVKKETEEMCLSILEYEKIYPKLKKLFENFQKAIKLETEGRKK